MILLYMIAIVMVIVFWMKYRYQYKPLDITGCMVMVAGLRGQGKSYYMASQAEKYLKKKRKVFTNYPVKGAFKLTFNDFMNKLFPENSVILYDESHNEFDSDKHRDEEIKSSMVMFTQSRKLGYTVVVGSQRPIRVVKALRDICDYFVWAHKGIFYFKYSVYLSFEDFTSRLLTQEFKIRRSKKMYKKYNTYFMHKELLDRDFVEEILWNDEEIKPVMPKKKEVEPSQGVDQDGVTIDLAELDKLIGVGSDV